jgi:hypothetical protein
MLRSLRKRLIVLALPLLAACFVIVSSGTEVTQVPRHYARTNVSSPVRAHLMDGSTVVYNDGIRVFGDTIHARIAGTRVGPLNDTIRLGPITVDSIVGLEVFERKVNAPATLMLSAIGTAVGTVATALGAALLFGSCPTIYADSAGVPVLQAEVFATRISPLLEARDIDLLSARPDAQGMLRLDVRNEALETHYINHLELLEVRHAVGTRLIPDEHGKPLVVGAWSAPAMARDGAGRELASVVARSDGNAFSTDSTVLANANARQPFDHIDLTFPRPAGDSAVIGLHLRNSLLNTVLLYDLMLAAPGARSLDWLSKDMRRIGPMLQFGRWYREHFGLRVFVHDGARWREIERHPTYGPVAWREAATVVPVLQRDSLRVRLRFAADEWRIDWIGMAGEFERPKTRTIGIARVTGLSDSLARAARDQLRAADDRYVQTGPGRRFWVSFETGATPPDSARTFLLASQGYYTEWLRGAWLKRATDTTVFRPGAAALDETFRRYAAHRDSIHRAFFATRIPVTEGTP